MVSPSSLHHRGLVTAFAPAVLTSTMRAASSCRPIGTSLLVSMLAIDLAACSAESSGDAAAASDTVDGDGASEGTASDGDSGGDGSGDGTTGDGDGDGDLTGQWIGGDLHLHSDHSNDALDNPMDAIVARAEGLGLGFFVVTDHDNHVDGQLTTWDDPAYVSDEMIMLYGVEWTTALGHANFFGVQPWDHPTLYALREGDPQDVADEAKAQGLHFSVNHPSNGDPWEYGFDHDFDSMEVWNAMYGLPPTENDLTAALWDELLMAGRRIAGRGGSDCHHQEGFEASMFNVGNPTTWVYVETATPQAVLDALRAGRATIAYSPLGERIELWADADADGLFEAMMGEALVDSDALELEVRIVGARPGASYDVSVIGDGVVVETYTQTSEVWRFAPPSPHASYYRVEVRGETPEAPPSGQGFFGGVVGLTNPIYVE